MKYWNLHKLQIPLILVAITIVVYSLFKFSSWIVSEDDHVVHLDEGWTISLNGKVLEQTTLSNAYVGKINAGDKVIFSRVLEDFGIDSPCASYYSVDSVIHAYLDDTLVYSYGDKYYEKGNLVPKRSCIISLGSDYIGKTLTIELIGSVKGAFSGLNAVSISNRALMFSSYIYNIRIPLFASFFLVTLGLILLILSPYLIVYHNNDLRLFFSCLISFSLGIYIAGYYGIFDFFLNSPILNNYCEYFSFYNIPTAILAYLFSVYHGKEKKMFSTILIFHIAFVLTIFILTLTKSYNVTSFIIPSHIVAFFESIATIAIITNFNIKSKKENTYRFFASEKVFIFGILVFILLALTDTLRYVYTRFTTPHSEVIIGLNGFSMGALIFVACLLISCLLYNISSPLYESMQSSIKDLAYTDPLTGLANRARCEKMFETLSEDPSYYAIISLDLNKLKHVNDTLGHHEGDRLLTGFSTILTDCFWDANLIGRMGGDEFVVVLIEDRANNCTNRIHELYSTISDWNKKEQNFSYSASYGYAYSNEVPSGSAKEVYMLADNRMYEMKREHQNIDKEVSTNA